MSLLGGGSSVRHRKVLVIGAGITGLAAANRLRAAGWAPVIVERTPHRRDGGYFIVLFEAGRIVAQRLGLLEHLHDRASNILGCTITRRGRIRPGPTFADLPNDPWLMLRGDVEHAAHAALRPDIEVRYGTRPTAIRHDRDGVLVVLTDSTGEQRAERFDLVLGCDGLRSTVRRMVFGPDSDFVKQLGFMVATCQHHGDAVTGLVRGQSAALLEPGRSMLVFAFADHEPTILFTYRSDDIDAEFEQAPAQRIRSVFGSEPLGDTLSDGIAALRDSRPLLFDSAQQVQMPRWHQGRVALIGDAAWCTSLYPGMGASAGLIGADLLGAMLERFGDDVDAALEHWDRSLRPYIAECQRLAVRQRNFFVADTQREVWMQTYFRALLAHRYSGWLRRTLKRTAMPGSAGDVVASIMSDAFGANDIALSAPRVRQCRDYSAARRSVPLTDGR